MIHDYRMKRIGHRIHGVEISKPSGMKRDDLSFCFHFGENRISYFNSLFCQEEIFWQSGPHVIKSRKNVWLLVALLKLGNFHITEVLIPKINLLKKGGFGTSTNSCRKKWIGRIDVACFGHFMVHIAYLF